MSKMIFMSHILFEGTPTYGDRDTLTITPKSEIKDGVGANTSTIHFSNNHMGTHMDTPFHFCENGKKTQAYKAEEFFFNNVAVVKLPCSEARLITREDLELNQISKEIDFLFIDTGYEQYRSEAKYHNDNQGLDASLADALRTEFPHLKAVGFDFISLTSWKFRTEGREGHRAFLCGDRPFLIVEDVSFATLKDRNIEWLVMAPLRTVDGNGGPVTLMAKLR
jgi:kynurenine formamidase